MHAKGETGRCATTSLHVLSRTHLAVRRLLMRFGIVAPPTPDLMTECETAEALGFEAAWLFDSHLVYSDVYVIMALCAQRTRRMSFGTGIAVASSRIAPVTAHTIATLNQLYPGRVVLGLGTGNTGRRTMGFAPMKARAFRDYVRTLKGLLRGETVAYREGDVMRPIRFLHPDQGIVNLDGPIPIYISAFGPQTLRMAGELGDGFITIWGSPDSIRAARAVLNDGAQRAGGDLAAEGFRIILFHNVYVLHPESGRTRSRHGWPLVLRSAPPSASGSMLAVWAARRHRLWRGALSVFRAGCSGITSTRTAITHASTNITS
jgi:5,10-methylenetetrahydromethanopterin reductase